jgi:NitT/TauT family transport system ATP-binding protein
METTADSALIRADGLEHRFQNGIAALGGVDLSVHPGEFVSLVGPSGCGKSTLLRLVAGLLAVGTGRLSIAGMNPRKARTEGHSCSFVFQSPTLLPWRTVEENVGLPMELEGARPTEIRDRSRHWLSRVGLEEFARAYPAQLSGGMRMRVSIARALSGRPRILLMDEPFAALDDLTRGRLQEELLGLRAKEGFTTIFVTHNVSEAVFLSDRVAVMSPRPGRIVGELGISFAAARDCDLRGEPQFARTVREASRLLDGPA